MVSQSQAHIFQAALHLCLALVAWVASACAANAAKAPAEIWKINVDGTGLMRVADTTGYTCGSPEWSPDGSYVAFGGWRVEQKVRDGHIFVVRADGTDRRDLGPGAMPNWSPDGKLLVFHTYGQDTDRIVVMNPDGSGRENIRDHWGSPRWSRRGNRIVSILYGNLALHDLATGVERTILPQTYPIDLGFGVSPDGKRFCFTGRDNGLFLATLDERFMRASVRTLLTSGKCHYASFAPDGKRIVFNWRPPGTNAVQLYILDVDGEPNPKHLDGQDKTRINWAPNWSPDGKTIVFASNARDQ